MKRVLLCVLLLSVVAATGDHADAGTSIHAGQSVAQDLVKHGKRVLEKLKATGAPKEKIDALEAALEETFVYSKPVVTVETPQGVTIEVDAANNPYVTPKEIVVSEDRWPKLSLDVRDDMAYHEYAGVIGWERSRYFVSAGTLAASAATTVAPPAEPEDCTIDFTAMLDKLKLTTATSYKDPYYGRYLVPGQFNYTEIFAAYDTMAEVRQANLERYKQVLASMKMDENGIIAIRKVSADSVYLQLYGQALAKSLSPASGLKLVAGAVIPNRVTVLMGLPGWGGRVMGQNFDGTYSLHAFLAVDPDAERKVEEIKLKGFLSLETMASEIRRRILETHSEDAKRLAEFKLLVAAFGSAPAESEILLFLQQLQTTPGNTLHVFHETARLATADEISQALSGTQRERVAQLKAAHLRIQAVNRCLTQGVK